MEKHHFFNYFKKSKSDYDYKRVATADPTEPRHSISTVYGDIISSQPKSRSNSLNKDRTSEKSSNYRPRSASNPKANRGSRKRSHQDINPTNPNQPKRPSNLISNKSKDKKANKDLSVPAADPKKKGYSEPKLHDGVDPNLPDQKKLRTGSVGQDYRTRKSSQSRPRSKTVSYISNRAVSIKEKWLPNALRSLQERHTKIENLDDRVENLEDDAKTFQKTTNETYRKLWWKSCCSGLCNKNTIVIVLVALLLLAIVTILYFAFR